MVLWSFYIGLIFVLSLWLASPISLGNQRVIPVGALALDEWLKKFNCARKIELKADFQIPKYKFYSEVVELILDIARRYGGLYEDNLLALREALDFDHQFEVKCKDLTRATWAQIFIMLFITWVFIFCSLSILEMKTPTLKLFLLLLWQLIGIILIPLSIRLLRKHYFSDVGIIWKSLYVLKSLMNVPLSRSEIFNHAELFKLKEINNKRLKSLIEQLFTCCERALKEGGSYENEINKIIKDLRFEENRIYTIFEKKLVVLKLGILSIFFLPSYLAFIYIILSDFIALM